MQQNNRIHSIPEILNPDEVSFYHEHVSVPSISVQSSLKPAKGNLYSARPFAIFQKYIITSKIMIIIAEMHKSEDMFLKWFKILTAHVLSRLLQL